MNEHVLDKILTKLRGEGWKQRKWLPARRTGGHSVTRHVAEVTKVVAERKTDQLEAISKQGTERAMPYIDASGDLRIPFDSPEKYHWWKGGQHVLDTLTELNADDEVLRKYSDLARR